MRAIVAVDSNWGIGCRGSLLARIPEDMKFFRRMTAGKVVIVGRDTLETFPGKEPLKGRTNIVLSRNRNYSCADAVVCHTLGELFEILRQYDTGDVFVIGGESVYRQLLPYCSEVYVTKIEKAFEADRHFENLDEKEGWKLSETGELSEHEGISYRFTTYINEAYQQGSY